MNSKESQKIQPQDSNPGHDYFRTEVISGLQKPQKELPCKYFYDERGSLLYERICNLDEYYLPRIEMTIMESHIEEMAELLKRHILLIEYGSGNCTKTRTLLDNLHDLAVYVPVDICREQLLQVTKELTSAYPQLKISPVCADFTHDFELPTANQPFHQRIVYFPGSTIGNFEPAQAKRLLENIARICTPDGGLLIGVDLKKDPAVLHRAYNDKQGITAAFNLNLLERINRELDCDFQLDCFKHYAFYNPRESRVEMHLISMGSQIVHLDDVTIPFARGESIWTESSYKYTLNEFERMAATAGFKVDHVWTDEQQWFSIHYLVNTQTTTA